jgi:organic solute transporter subunit alpha
MIHVNGESGFISIASDETFSLRAPPLCCCLPLKASPMSKEKFKFVKFLIIQMPIAHIGIFLVLNIIYIEDIQAFDELILYFIPFIAITVLGGIWGYNITVRTLSPYYANLKLIQKYFAFQLVLFFCKILPILLNAIMKIMIKTCDGPFTIVVKRHTIIQILVQIEMVLLSVWAHILYKNPLGNKV